MTDPTIPLPSPIPAAEQLPSEWALELSQLTGEDRANFVLELQELGLMANVVGEEPVTGEEELTVAGDMIDGFRSKKLVRDGAILPMAQFDQRIYSFQPTSETLTMDVVELESDTGARLRVIDLRSEMNPSLAKIEPKSKTEKVRLDRAFWMDMKNYADTGRMAKTVKAVSSVAYSAVDRTCLRAYWTLVEDKNNPDAIRTVARLGDIANNPKLESDLYARMFRVRMKK